MKLFATTIFCCMFLFAGAQTTDDLDSRIHGVTTIVKTQLLNHTEEATGFFYFKIDSIRKDHWFSIKDMWLITNKHVVVFKDTYNKEHLADNLIFYLRYHKKDSLYWNPVKINFNLLKTTARFSKYPGVDIVAIPVTKLMNKHLVDSAMSGLFGGVSEQMFPDRDSTMTPQVSDDVIVVGYPSGFYDKQHLFPIVKTGIIASRWGGGFNNQAYFLIDLKLFPQSSGSLVLSKPNNYMVKKGVMLYSTTKQFVFLGIYSGEPIKLDLNDNDSKISIQKYDLGVVWYYTAIQDVINNGVLWKE